MYAQYRDTLLSNFVTCLLGKRDYKPFAKDFASGVRLDSTSVCNVFSSVASSIVFLGSGRISVVTVPSSSISELMLSSELSMALCFLLVVRLFESHSDLFSNPCISANSLDLCTVPARMLDCLSGIFLSLVIDSLFISLEDLRKDSYGLDSFWLLLGPVL